MDTIDQITDAVSWDSAAKCLDSTTHLQVQALDESLLVERKIQENSKEGIKATLKLMNHHDHEEQPTRKEHETKNLMELALLNQKSFVINEMGMKEEKQIYDSTTKNAQSTISQQSSIIDLPTEKETQDTTKQNLDSKTVDAADKQKQNYQHALVEYQGDVTCEEEEDSASFMVKEDRDLKTVKN